MNNSNSGSVQRTGNNDRIPAWAVLGAITVTAGLLIGATNAFTSGAIAEQNEVLAHEARQLALPAAEEFVRLPVDGDSVDSYFIGVSGGEIAGSVVSVTVRGYGGPIEVTTGVGSDGVVAGVSVGGADFSETAGLGAKTKDEKFTSQFEGMSGELKLTKFGGTVDSVTGASVSSAAVVSAVNAAIAQAAGAGVDSVTNPTP